MGLGLVEIRISTQNKLTEMTSLPSRFELGEFIFCVPALSAGFAPGPYPNQN